jgi:hypothetical protein
MDEKESQKKDLEELRGLVRALAAKLGEVDLAGGQLVRMFATVVNAVNVLLAEREAQIKKTIDEYMELATRSQRYPM